ncbi:hypothetical protein WHR41_00577 [Cladosporium halotolerans]|uniref:DUF2423 domain-containing protein n=1 Tax=Cladosporium halotolerans TaxID=1052096 RepID=A0AB34L6M7_9PEZI
MAKGLRASRNKKNNQALSKRVFAPVEAARNERLSAKLLELARQPKAPKEEMEIEQDSSDKKSGAAAEDPEAMQEDDADGAPLTKTTTRDRSITKQKADRVAKKNRIEKRKAKPKPQNSMTFSGGKKTRKGGR